MLLRSAKLHYPVTVTRLYVDSANDIAKAAPLFEYTWNSKVEELDELGESRAVERDFYGDYVAPVEGSITAWKVKVGTVIVQDGVPLVEIEEPCLHEVQFAGLCTICGKDMTEVDYASTQRLTDRASINIAHGSTQLLVSQGEASRISEESRKRLLAGRKLSLVVDLDQTVIQATVDPTVGEGQKDPDNPNFEALKDVREFQLADEGPGGRGCSYYIKIRPGLVQFLEQVSNYYELHVYTMATRLYAQNVAKIIDPERRIFADRIISRDESGSMAVKSLHRLFPVDTKMVVIIDDRADVWRWSDNLVKVPAYDFFVGIGDINSSFLPKKEILQREAKSVHAKKEAEKAAAAQNAADELASTALDLPKKGDDELSAIEQQLVALAGGDNPRHLEALTEEQDQAINAQLEDRPLLKMQEKMDKVLDEEASKAVGTGEDSNDTASDSQRHRHNLLQDDDRELDHLQQALLRVHKTFYDDYERKLAGSQGGRIAELRGEKGTKRRLSDDAAIVPDIKDIMPRMKEEVLKGVVLVFSGVVPLNVDVQVSDIGLWAKSFGARVDHLITSATTHVVATRTRRTQKVRQAAARPKISIVIVDWLIEAFSTWRRPDERPYKVDVEPDENGVHHSNDDKDIINALEHGDEFLSGTDEDEEDDVETEATETEMGQADYDDDIDDDADAARSPVDNVKNDDWEAMNKEIMDELGSDFDSDESDQSDASSHSRNSRGSRRSRTSNAERASRKRKRGDSSAENSEGDGEGGGPEKALLNGQGSNLQRRKKKALERVSSLTNVASANNAGLGLPSPGADGAGEPGVKAGSNGAGQEGEDDGGDEDEDLDIDLEAEFDREFDNAMSADEAGDE